MEYTSAWYFTCLVLNFIVLGSGTVMYIIETRREFSLIKILEENPSSPCDEKSVEDEINKHLTAEEIVILRRQVDAYKYSSLITMGLFVINAVYSAMILVNYNIGTQTFTTYATNVIFMMSKFKGVFGIINVGPSIFYSAYLVKKVQFNYIDPDFRKKL